MEHYVTLFDSLFLPQGVALHGSLERHAGSYTLWVLCVDECAHEVLSKLSLPNMRLLRLAEWETPELLRVKPGRSRSEYCWTLTPFAPRFVFDADASVQRVTYVDADVWFRDNPHRLLQGFLRSGKAVQITDHAYAPEYDQAAHSGRFCVQFLTFDRDAGEPVRTWWAQRCLEWCHARVEDGKFGDQLYLQDWPQRFANLTHVLQDLALLQAPWNATRFPPSDAVAYHFHGLRLLRSSRVLLTDYYHLNATTVATLYGPYIADLRHALALMASVGYVAPPQLGIALTAIRLRILGRRVKGLWRFAFHAPVVPI